MIIEANTRRIRGSPRCRGSGAGWAGGLKAPASGDIRIYLPEGFRREYD